jgi:hypothetical protein
MAVKPTEPENPGILLIDFNPVVREGLRAVLGHCQKTRPKRHRQAAIAAQAGVVGNPVSPVVEAQLELGS